MRVLIVDDNEASAKTLGWMIELMGHEIQLALEGTAAIEVARKFHPHIVMLDIGLPTMNGYEVCALMRQETTLVKTIFIAQTGWGQQEHRQRSKEAGFDHHMVKPIDIHKLQDLIAATDMELSASVSKGD